VADVQSARGRGFQHRLRQTAPPLSGQFSLVAYDNLGAGEGDIVGIVEGAEATAPFDFPIPIDAITVAIFDSLSYQPPVS
jgi:carbon dioxide concentrating mechanism protein CcmL